MTITSRRKAPFVEMEKIRALRTRPVFREAGGMTSAESSSLDGMVERIRGIAVDGLFHPDAGSLLHAYIACIPPGPLPYDW
jgi:hypothetical protein